MSTTPMPIIGTATNETEQQVVTRSLELPCTVEISGALQTSSDLLSSGSKSEGSCNDGRAGTKTCLTLSGTEGKLFKPMATTVLFARLPSLVIALTLMPVVAWYTLREQRSEEQTRLMRRAGAMYRPA